MTVKKRRVDRRRHRGRPLYRGRLNRRKDDRMTKGDKVKTGAALSAIVIGWTVFIYQMQEILQKHTDWNQLRTPPGVAEILSAMGFATMAFGGALFGDIGKMLAIVKGKLQ